MRDGLIYHEDIGIISLEIMRSNNQSDETVNEIGVISYERF